MVFIFYLYILVFYFVQIRIQEYQINYQSNTNKIPIKYDFTLLEYLSVFFEYRLVFKCHIKYQ
jgi:hypothetical protein